MRSIFFFILMPLLSWGQSATVSTEAPQMSAFSGEVGYQVHSLPMKGSQMFGPSIMYRLNQQHSGGTRLLFSSTDSEERRLSAFWRITFGRRYFYWIVEPHYSYLWRRPSEGDFSSTGFGTGFQYRVSPELMLGAIAGLEQMGPVFPVGPFWSRPSFILFTHFDF